MVITESKAIKKKLMAATSMLLVACIMLISASYAWFTLSTAPEVTGITTAVGANGNLEIALADASTWSNPDSLVQASVNSSSLTKQQANITWGNLIDVKDGYGLDQISLLPSRLAVKGTEGNYAVNASPLLTPSYGSDGRVAELESTTDYGKLVSADKFEISADRGVRAIGAASGMTDRQLAYRNAKITLANATADAKVQAKTSLEESGTALANIIMKEALHSAEGTSYTQDDVAVIREVIDSVEKAQEKLIEGWEAAVLGFAASKGGEGVLADEIAYMAFAGTFKAGYTVDTDAKTLTVGSDVLPLPGEFASYYAKANAVKTAITTANTALIALEDAGADATFTWNQIATPLNTIVNSNQVTINGFTKDQVKDNMGAVAESVLGGGGLQVQMPSGAGVYADIADFCGNYSAGVELQNLSYGTVTLEKVDATMTTTSAGPAYFTTASTFVAAAGSPEGGGAANSVLTDFYGYAVDFYLRTNASGSNLLLQVDEAQRIYDESANEDTQGGGSNMTFTSADTSFSTNQVKNLMGAIRVVFTDADGAILGIAVLDTANAEVAGSTVKADLKLCQYVFNKDEQGKVTTISIVDADTEDDNTDEADFDYLKVQKITSLTQNVATKVSAMVYLDGDVVTNAMVANAMQSMTGSMNLQFASDADLVPMVDTGLQGVVTE